MLQHKGHIHCCFRDELKSNLESLRGFTVKDNETECLKSVELYKDRPAAHIVIGENVARERVMVDDPEDGKSLGAAMFCAYKCELEVVVEVYIVGCTDDMFCDLKSLESNAMPTLVKQLDGTRRVNFINSTLDYDNKKAKQVGIATFILSIEHIFIPDKPWCLHN